MLMDLFYDTVTSNIISKRRIHFHAFMIEVHRMVHEMKEKFGNRADVVVPVAREMARNARVLCFDEFQVGLKVVCSI
jgi:protein AFG1